MKTRIEQEEDQAMVMQIPQHIREDIEEKGFHLYTWISPDEVKLSIERDFLKTIKYIGLPLGILAIIAGLLTIIGFFVVIIVGIFLMFLYLFILSIRRSFLLSKSAFVVLTDSSVSLGGKIHKLSDLSDMKKDMDHVGKVFEEKIFEPSQLSASKSSLTQSVMDQLFGGYKTIFSLFNTSGRRSDDTSKGLLLLIVFYTAYIGIMVIVYFIGVLGLLVFGKLIIWINTQYLLKKGHSVTQINSYFGKIDRASKDIYDEKYNLEKLLTQAYENNWKDGLLLEINKGIAQINKDSQTAVLQVLELRNTIESSKYKDMFSFSVYNSWIKKQIAQPLEQILLLLRKNEEILEITHKEIETQIQNTHKAEYQGTLKLQLQRIELQKREIERYIPMMEASLEKLK